MTNEGGGQGSSASLSATSIMATLSTALQQLANFRLRNARSSQETFDAGVTVLKNKAVNKMGDDGWAFLEQLALASIDVGRLDIADECIRQLKAKFPGSPRVDCLTGIRIEATEAPEVALKYYDSLLDADSSNGAAWKRRISVLARMGKTEQAAEELSQFLDTFYTDIEGWLELADMYASVYQYADSFKALSHVLLLAPQNPFYVLQAAETAYTAGDVPLACKMYLLVVDMTAGEDGEVSAESVPTGITVRAWYGVKQTTGRLLKEPELASSSASQTPPPVNLQLVDELAKEQLRAAYSTSVDGHPPQGRDELFIWVR